jgi:hypothetical protein
LCTFKVHKTVIKHIDKFRKHYLWTGADINAKKPPKVAWDMVCLPKDQGGLGIIQLEAHNEALLIKNFHKFFNKLDTPWVHLVWEKYYSNGKLPNHTLKGSFWWKDILRLLSKFKEMSSVSAFRGDSCFLWKDKWHTPILDQAFPELMSFAKNKNITIFKAKEALSPNELSNLPLAEEAFNQLLELAQILEDLPSLDQDDIWTYD